MGSAGLAWDTADVITKARMNQKNLFVGTGTQIAALTTYAGQFVFCTSSGSGFLVDTLYQRNTADDTWVPVGVDSSPYLNLSTTIGDYTRPALAIASSSNATPTVSDDFTSYADTTAGDAAWPTSDTAHARVNPTTDVIDYSGLRDASNDSISRAVTAVSDSAWVLRFRFNLTSWTAGADAQMAVVLSDSTYATGSVTNQDALGFALGWNTTTSWGIVYADGAAITIDGGSEKADISFTTATNYYVQFARTSTTTVECKIFSDSAYSTQIGTTASYTCAATIASLDNIKISNRALSNTGAGAIVAVVDDVNLYDAVIGVPDATSAVDDNVLTAWKSTSEANPSIYVDLSSAREVAGVALNINKTDTTVTSLKIRASTDTSFSDGENIAYVNISDFTDDTWRFLANNFIAANTRYVQFYANETGVLSINEIKVRYGVTDAIKILTHKHRTRTVSVADSFTDSN